MMVSPDWYYEEYLKGKTPEQIMTKIRSLKREITRLQDTIDHPDYRYREEVMDPSESVQLSVCRDYLERAKQALVEAGGIYKPTQSELKAAAIEASMSYVTKVVFSKGGFFVGGYKKTFTVGEKTLHMREEKLLSIEEPVIKDISEYREEFLEELADLHLERWRRHYDLYRYSMAVMDGETWNLEVYFSNGHRPLKISGDNAYPFNFYYLEDVLGLPFEQEE